MPQSDRSSTTLRTADAAPSAAALIESLRDIGYTFESAIADIVDNAITAGAGNIRILSETAVEEPVVGILDDGTGMTEPELVRAMRLGSGDPLEARAEADLGRFGLGMKSASFSQCRRLTVISRREGTFAGAIWDLDRVRRTDAWEVEVLDTDDGVPFADQLPEDHGTLILWEKTDRLAGGIARNVARRTEHLNRTIAHSERHLTLVFHRFMEDGLRIFLNGRPLKPLDPFASTHPACQPDPEEELHLKDGVVRIQAFTLPHHKATTKAEWEEIGGPEGHLKSQGFWVYRGRRLIIPGSWLGLARQTETSKLCRIRIDIPNTMDPAWKIDVKKASAQLPPAVRDRLKTVAERMAATSRRTYRRRGRRLTDDDRLPLWTRTLKDGGIVYEPNTDHPVLADFRDDLGPEERARFGRVVRILGAGLPIEALHTDMAGQAEEVRAAGIDPEMLEEGLRSIVPALRDQGIAGETIRKMLRDQEPWRSAREEAGKMIDRILAGETTE